MGERTGIVGLMRASRHPEPGGNPPNSFNRRDRGSHNDVPFEYHRQQMISLQRLANQSYVLRVAPTSPAPDNRVPRTVQ